MQNESNWNKSQFVCTCEKWVQKAMTMFENKNKVIHLVQLHKKAN